MSKIWQMSHVLSQCLGVLAVDSQDGGHENDWSVELREGTSTVAEED